MKLQEWFSTPIWYEDLTDDFSVVTNELILFKEQNDGVQKSNVHGYQSQNICFVENKEIKNFLSIIESYANKGFSYLKTKFPIRLVLDNAWLNINNKNAYNIRHCHPFSKFSCVVYLKAPQNCGELMFYRNDLMRHYFDPNMFEEMHDCVSYVPRNNLMVLFPSWLEHDVRPNMSEEDRVSIACNFILREKK